MIRSLARKNVFKPFPCLKPIIKNDRGWSHGAFWGMRAEGGFNYSPASTVLKELGPADVGSVAQGRSNYFGGRDEKTSRIIETLFGRELCNRSCESRTNNFWTNSECSGWSAQWVSPTGFPDCKHISRAVRMRGTHRMCRTKGLRCPW